MRKKNRLVYQTTKSCLFRQLEYEYNDAMIPNDEKQDAGDVKNGEKQKLPLSKVAIYVLLGIGGLIILAAVVAVIITPPIARHNRDHYERVAMATLIELAKLQEEYRGINEDGHYGTMRDLCDEGLLDPPVGVGNILDHFYLDWTRDRKMRSQGGPIYGSNTFTIVAYPLDTRRGYMSTYGIREDGLIRRYVPNRGGAEDDVSTWTRIDDTSEFPEVSFNPSN